MVNDETVTALAAGVGFTLPVGYLEFLDRLSGRDESDDEMSLLDYEGQSWQPHSRDRLAAIVPHRRRESAFPYAHEMARHAEMLRAADDDHGGEASAGLIEQGFTLERLARGFCVGCDENGDPLFVDPESGGVFLFSHDSLDVEAWAPSLSELLQNSVGEQDPED